MTAVLYAVSPPIVESALNALFARAWDGHRDRAYAPILARSLLYVTASIGDRLVGFANVATDGGAHAFLLDPTVDREFQRQGIGTALVQLAAREAKARGCEWFHVDYEPHLVPFYTAAGFRPSTAGVMHLDRTG